MARTRGDAPGLGKFRLARRVPQKGPASGLVDLKFRGDLCRPIADDGHKIDLRQRPSQHRQQKAAADHRAQTQGQPPDELERQKPGERIMDGDKAMCVQLRHFSAQRGNLRSERVYI